jgi:hypothetical protein
MNFMVANERWLIARVGISDKIQVDVLHGVNEPLKSLVGIG